MTTGKKNIIFLILAIILVVAIAGFYFYNKGPVNIKTASAIKIDAASLYQAFSKDSAGAKKIYWNNILEVSGIVKKVSKNQENQSVVLLQTNEAGAYINCTLEEPVGAIAENSQAILKGICTGMGMGDADLGIMGDVYLVRCYLKK